MIQKKAVKTTLFSKFQKGLKVVIAAEIAAFLGSYCVWLRMNRDQGNSKINHFLLMLTIWSLLWRRYPICYVQYTVFVKKYCGFLSIHIL